MPYVKKISSTWTPSEHQDLEVGDVVYVDNGEKLVELGDAVYCDEKGNELPSTEAVMKCPICVYKETDPFVYARHILSHEKKGFEITQKIEDRVGKIVNEEKPKRTPEEMRAFRIENLRKAREARKAKVV